jgi:hypothetical protein
MRSGSIDREFKIEDWEFRFSSGINRGSPERRSRQTIQCLDPRKQLNIRVENSLFKLISIVNYMQVVEKSSIEVLLHSTYHFFHHGIA